MDKREQVLSRKLYKELKLKYPPHHWKHLQVWDKYWCFVECLGVRVPEKKEVAITPKSQKNQKEGRKDESV